MPRKTSALLVLLGVLIGCAATQLAPRAAEAQAPAVAPSADAVEYRVIDLYVDPGAKMMQQLNALGAQGWRVVAPVTFSGNTKNVLLMRTKR